MFWIALTNQQQVTYPSQGQEFDMEAVVTLRGAVNAFMTIDEICQFEIYSCNSPYNNLYSCVSLIHAFVVTICHGCR